MDQEQLFKDAQQILSSVLKIAPTAIMMQSKLQDDLGVDSVDFWDIIARFDKKYKIRISEKEAESVQTIEDMISALSQELKKKK